MQLVLDRIADAERRKRLSEGVGSIGFGVFLGALGVDLLVSESISSMMVVDALTGETPSETLAEVWREDPSLNQYRPTVSVGEHQASLGVWGTW